jgi:hypothetical protein
LALCSTLARSAPACRRDVRVDDDVDAERLRCSEDLVRGRRVEKAVRRGGARLDEDRVRRGRDEAVLVERRLESIDATDEVEGLDASEADRCELAERPVEVRLGRSVHRVQLNRDLRCGHV